MPIAYAGANRLQGGASSSLQPNTLEKLFAKMKVCHVPASSILLPHGRPSSQRLLTYPLLAMGFLRLRVCIVWLGQCLLRRAVPSTSFPSYHVSEHLSPVVIYFPMQVPESFSVPTTSSMPAASAAETERTGAVMATQSSATLHLGELTMSLIYAASCCFQIIMSQA